MNGVEIKSVQYYFKKYGQRIAKGERVSEVKEDLIAEFKAEVISQILFKTGKDNIKEIERTDLNEKIVINIVINARKKLESIIRRFNLYKETYGMLKPDDISFDEFGKEEPEESTDESDSE